jgi:hypothetical protein
MIVVFTLTLKAWMLVPAFTTAIAAAVFMYLSWADEGFYSDSAVVSAVLWAAMTAPAITVALLA